MKMVKVGVTGGIGSGKTTVCKVWERKGAFVVYSDELAKELMVEDQNLIKKIRSEFGDESYLQDGSLNRKYLAEIAFEQGKVETLNRLVHPVVREKVKLLMEKSEKEKKSMFVQEAALLLNEGRPDYFDYIVLVSAAKDKRVDWVSHRDLATKEEVISRMVKQQNFDRLAVFCDFLILNDGAIEDLEKKADLLFDQLLNPSKT